MRTEKPIKLYRIDTNGMTNDGQYKYRVIGEWYVAKLPMGVELTHPITKEKRTIENQFVLYRNEPEKPYLVVAMDIKDPVLCEKIDAKSLLPSHEIKHPNVSTSLNTFLFSMTKINPKPAFKLHCKNFCNPYLGVSLVENPSQNLMMIALQLQEYNFNSPLFRDFMNFIDLDCTDRVQTCRLCGNPIMPSDGVVMKASNTCINCFEKETDGCLSYIQNHFQDEPGGVFYKYKFDKRYNYGSNIDVRSSDISKVYEVLDQQKVEEQIGQIPKRDIDILCMGLGSAGSGFLDQVGRTNMFNSYSLVDFDIIEEKNLRNQLYHKSTIGKYKADSMAIIVKSFKGNDSAVNVLSYKKKFQEIRAFEYCNFKYAMLGFDTVQTRLEAMEKILNEQINTKYIVDTRYDGLNASIYLVDKSNQEQVKYYMQALEADYNLFEEIKRKKEEADMQYWKPVNAHSKEFEDYCELHKICGFGCDFFCSDVLKLERKPFCMNMGNNDRLKENDDCCTPFENHCKYEIADYINANKVKIIGLTFNPPQEEEQQTTCVDWNIIDIYKYASTYLTAAIREIENGNPKPFTHIECTTNGMPSALVMCS